MQVTALLNSIRKQVYLAIEQTTVMVLDLNQK